MGKFKKQTALMMTAVMLTALVGVPIGKAEAEEAVQEYVVMVENDNGYLSYVSQADPVTYNKYSTWFKERTTQKSVLEGI